MSIHRNGPTYIRGVSLSLEIGCTIKSLPDDSRIFAARSAISSNPANRPSLDGPDIESLQPQRLALLTTKWWGSDGCRLTVGFMEPTSNELATKLLRYMNRWSEYANVSFVPSSTDPQVRITRQQSGYWSYLGTDILHVGRNEPTLCFQDWSMSQPDSEWERVVVHEAGHTLGCPHEHLRRDLVARIDIVAAYRYFRRTQGWSNATTAANVLTPLDEASLMATPNADQTSIMAYFLPGEITRDGKPIVGGSTLAPQDIEFIAKVYPKQVTPPIDPPSPLSRGGCSLSWEGDTITVTPAAGQKIIVADEAAQLFGDVFQFGDGSMRLLERLRIQREIIRSYRDKVNDGMTHDEASDAVLEEAHAKFGGGNIDWAKVLEIVLAILAMFGKVS